MGIRLKLVTQYTQQLNRSKLKFSRADFFIPAKSFQSRSAIGGEFVKIVIFLFLGDCYFENDFLKNPLVP